MPPKSTPKSKSNEHPHFKPDSKVEIMSDEEGFRGSFYTGTVLKATRTPKFTVQYDQLFEDEEGTVPLQETVNEFQIRPMAPREKKREFKISEEVDAFHNDGWWEGIITEVHGNGKFAVFFRSTKEQIEFREGDLRLHREWAKGEWTPALEREEEKEEIEEVKEVKEKGNEGSKRKKKLSAKDEEKEVKKEAKKRVNEKVPSTTEVKPTEPRKDVKFRKGMLVEVSSDEDGFKSACFAARRDSELALEREEEKEDRKEVKGVKENGNEGSKRKKKLSAKDEEKEVKKEAKRMVNEKVPSTTEVKPAEPLKDVKFRKGMLVEVSSDEDGFKGAWFAANIVEPVGKDKYLIQYHSLRTDDESDFLREEIDIMHIRPSPPQAIVVDRFRKLEEVDALYNDAWWVGVVSKVNPFPKYVVYFKDSDEELEFQHSDLRPHQDWINGKWFTPSKALKL